MDGRTVITIGREFGSGGHEIGMKLAERLGIKCYDKELLELAAKESGLCEELFASQDEKPTNSFLYIIYICCCYNCCWCCCNSCCCACHYCNI